MCIQVRVSYSCIALSQLVLHIHQTTFNRSAVIDHGLFIVIITAQFSAQKICKVNLSRYNINYWPDITKEEDNEPAQTTGIQQVSVHVQGP